MGRDGYREVADDFRKNHSGINRATYNAVGKLCKNFKESGYVVDKLHSAILQILRKLAKLPQHMCVVVCPKSQ